MVKYRDIYRNKTDIYNDVKALQQQQQQSRHQRHSSDEQPPPPRAGLHQARQVRMERYEELYEMSKEICQIACENDIKFSQVLSALQQEFIIN